MTQPGKFAEFRPSRERFRPVWRNGLTSVAILVGGVLVLGLIAFRGDVLALLGAAAPLLVVIGGTLTFIVALDVRPKIVIGPDKVVVRRLTRGRTTARADVGTAVLTTVNDHGFGYVQNPELTGVRLYLLRKDGSRMANLAEEYWGLDQFTAMTRLLGVPTDEVGALTPRQLRRRYKGAVPWAAAHVVTSILLAVLGLFILCFVVLAVVSVA